MKSDRASLATKCRIAIAHTAFSADSSQEKSVHRCDCGSLAYRKNGSGWFCRACEIAVGNAQRDLDEHIRKERAERELAYLLQGPEIECKTDKRAYYRIYARQHRAEANERYKRWKAKQLAT